MNVPRDYSEFPFEPGTPIENICARCVHARARFYSHTLPAPFPYLCGACMSTLALAGDAQVINYRPDDRIRPSDIVIAPSNS